MKYSVASYASCLDGRFGDFTQEGCGMISQKAQFLQSSRQTACSAPGDGTYDWDSCNDEEIGETLFSDSPGTCISSA